VFVELGLLDAAAGTTAKAVDATVPTTNKTSACLLPKWPAKPVPIFLSTA
jgi:hypothetical protein